MATTSEIRPRRSSTLKRNKSCSPDKEINVLLLGQTGVGKSTFINAFVNYLIYDTLDEAIDGEMQVIIPSSVSFTDPETFEEKLITVGNENCRENGQTGTSECQSYVLPIGDRNLRLIDGPGMGGPRGLEQDYKNLYEILAYISHYEHLNGICIFLKPNEERLTVAFRLCIEQVLHYLHASVKDNILFIFTNSRSTFFMPGSSKKLLQVLLNEQRDKDQIEIPFSRDNTFLLDNESFRYLVLSKNKIQINQERIKRYQKSWEHTAKEYQRLLSYIVDLPLCAVSNTLCLNEAEQLIRKLPRPIAETLRLIQLNIQLAKDRKQELDNNQRNTINTFFQYKPYIESFEDPKLICISEKCSEIHNPNKEKKFIFYRVCKKVSYLNGIIQEAINDSRIAQCNVIDSPTDRCKKCDCNWKHHMHTTFDYHRDLIPQDIANENNKNKDNQSSINFIDQHIKKLQEEQAIIENVYKTLSKFLYINAIYPFNDDFSDYFQLFIQEEEMKREGDDRNADLINCLSNIKMSYEDHMNNFRKTLTDDKSSGDMTDTVKSEEVFTLVGTLYRLPINGKIFREMVDMLKISEHKAARRMEKSVDLPEKAATSKTMLAFKKMVDSARF